MEESLFVVAAALVDASGRVLMQQRPVGGDHPGLWEFPGGKIERQEAAACALARELEEELGIAVDEADLEAAFFADVAAGDRRLLLLLYLCRAWRGVPVARHAQTLLWCGADDLARLAMPPADVPLAQRLAAMLRLAQG